MNRRRFLAAGLAIAATGILAQRKSLAQVPSNVGPLRPGIWLGIPDFADLASSPFRQGLRPFREGGVRLGIDRSPDAAGSNRVLIHNYGHGGAGITLAWGCAAHVRNDIQQVISERLNKPRNQVRVAIVGCGVVGLTTAAELKRWAPDMSVTVFAKNVTAGGIPLPQLTTSWIAGGQFEPSGIWREYRERDKLGVLHDLVRQSHARIIELTRSRRASGYGIVSRKNYILDHEDDGAFAQGMPRNVVPAARRGTLPFRPLRQVVGKEYSTWLINPTILLPRLVSELRAANVRFHRRDVGSMSDLLAIDADVIVNCSGLGAKAMLSDTAMKPIRGQLVVLDNPKSLDYFFSGGCGNEAAYMFARQNDIVIGGTYHECANVNDLPIESFEDIKARLKAILSGDITACKSGYPVKPPLRCNS